MAQTNRPEQDPSLCLLLQGQLTESEEHIIEKHSASTLFKWEGKGMGLGKERRVKIRREDKNERKRLREG